MPHIIVQGNSIDGTHKDYLMASTTKQQHDKPDCLKNEEHILKLLAHDHDRLALSFFARHPHYAFDAKEKERQDDGDAHPEHTLLKQMDHFFPGLAQSWSASNKEADEMGTAGTSLHIFGWQHVFPETKGRIAKLVANLRDTLPISAPFEKLEWKQSIDSKSGMVN